MLETVRGVVMVGLLALSPGLFASAEKPTEAQENKASEKQAKADHKLAVKIQKSVAKDDSLPPASRNIEVSVQNGIVTLKGEVQSDEESQAIQGKAESLMIDQTPDELVSTSSRDMIHNEIVVDPH